MLYEMLTGRLPFVPPSADPLALVVMQAEEALPSLRQRCPDASPALEDLVRAALSRDPDMRPPAGRLARRLAMVVADPFTPLDEEPEAPGG
jgi:serine/threonine protein kinase